MLPMMRANRAQASGPVETVGTALLGWVVPQSGAGEKYIRANGVDGDYIFTLAAGDLLLLYTLVTPNGLDDPGVPSLTWNGRSFSVAGSTLTMPGGAGLLDCYACMETSGGTGPIIAYWENGDSPPSYVTAIAVKLVGLSSESPAETHAAGGTSTDPASGTVTSPAHGVVIGAVGWVTNPANKGAWGTLAEVKAVAGMVSLEVAALVTTNTVARQANKTGATSAVWGARVAAFTAA